MKSLHIVFGIQANAIIQHSEIYDTDKISLVYLSDPLTIGPILHLDAKKGKENRINWLTEIFQEFPASEIADMVQSDIDLINTLKNSIDHYSQIYIWTGSDVNEIISASRLLYFLEIPSSAPIFIIDFLNTSVTRNIGAFTFPKSLNETNINQVAELYTHFKLLEQQEFQKMQSLWEKLSNDNANLRIAVDGSQISGSKIDFYDAHIMAQCTKQYQVAVKIIGKVLGYMNNKNIGEAIGDSFLNWRLKQMIEDNKLKYRGNMSSMRNYEVRLT